jgi:hypothetical protein
MIGAESGGKARDLIEWFMESPIYAGGGRYRAYYHEAELGPIYPEITAYAISLACLLYKEYRLDDFLKRGKECADYLIGLVPEGGLPSYKTCFRFSFDTGMFVSGLLDLYEITREEQYLSAAKKNLGWMLKLFDGQKFKALDGQGDASLWAESESAHLVKLAIPLLKAHVMLKSDDFKNIGEALLNWGAGLQTGEGNFRINEKSGRTRTHPHCYATEGFLFAYYCLKTPQYLEVVKKSLGWLARAQTQSGAFHTWYPEKTWLTSSTANDAAAQAVRLWKILNVHLKERKKAESFLEGSRRTHDGLFLTRRRLEVWRGKGPVYSWPTFFYLHALILPDDDMERASEIF